MVRLFSSLIAFLTVVSAPAWATAPSTATINLVATVPDSCSLTVNNSIDALSLGEAIRSSSLERFQVPVEVDCNTPDARLMAQPTVLTSPQAPGYEVYYQVNTDLGVNNGMGWINTSFTAPALLMQFPAPVKQEIEVLLEGFKEANNKPLPAGNYSGYIQLTIGAQ